MQMARVYADITSGGQRQTLHVATDDILLIGLRCGPMAPPDGYPLSIAFRVRVPIQKGLVRFCVIVPNRQRCTCCD